MSKRTINVNFVSAAAAFAAAAVACATAPAAVGTFAIRVGPRMVRTPIPQAQLANAYYAMTQIFSVGGKGRWDYMRLNAGGTKLYVTRVTYTMVINTASGQVIARIPGNDGSHGVALVPRLHRGFISNGKGNFVSVFNTKTDAVLGKIPVAKGPDCIIDDPASKKVLAFCGGSDVMTPINENVNPKNGKAGKSLALGGRPEYAVSDHKGRVYVNLVDKNVVDVIDTKTMKIVRRFPLGAGKHPTGISMDRKRGVLFVGCRNRRMIVVNARTGGILATLPIGAGVDATAFDGNDALASCGSGELTDVRRAKSGAYFVFHNIQTQRGARTMAVDKTHKIVYLATATLTSPVWPTRMTRTSPRPRPKPLPNTFRILICHKSGIPAPRAGFGMGVIWK